jgi:hypothetical protein
VLAAQVRPGFLRRQRVVTLLFAIAGTASLFLVGDFFWPLLGIGIGDAVEGWLGDPGLNLVMVAVATLTLLLVAGGLCSKLIRSQRWIFWLFVAAAAISLFDLASYTFYLLGLPSLASEWAFVIAITPSVLYFVVPVGLWYQFGLSPREGSRAAWPGIRLRIALLYLPAVVFDCGALATEIKPGGLWGLLPYFVGVNLISLGYMDIKQQLDSSLTEQPITGSESVPVPELQRRVA